MNATQKRIPFHILGWTLYIGYTVLGYFINDWKFNTLMLKLSHDVLHLVQFYTCYFLVFPLWMSYRSWFLLLSGVAGVILLFILLRFFIEETLYPALFGFRNYHPGTTLSQYFIDNLYWSLPGIFLGAVVWAFESTLQKERENRFLKQEKAQAELAFLKTQVNPHFLYNTLNYIYSLAYPVSDKLANAIISLSDLMRYMLHESKDGKVELQKEVEYLRSYIDIYRLRFEDRLFVDFNITGVTNGQRIPSLILIPFVENALKHGIVDNSITPVGIDLRVENNDLYFEVCNSINQNQKDLTTGIGLANIKRRLELLYPKLHSLEIMDDGMKFQTRLKIEKVS